MAIQESTIKTVLDNVPVLSLQLYMTGFLGLHVFLPRCVQSSDVALVTPQYATPSLQNPRCSTHATRYRLADVDLYRSPQR